MIKIAKQLIIMAMLFVATLLFLSSCIPMQPEGPPPTPAETYLTARMVFNGLLEDYVAQKKIADPATKSRWTQEIDPWFIRGASALDAWKVAVRSGEDPQGQMQAYLEIKNQLMSIILTELAE